MKPNFRGFDKKNYPLYDSAMTTQREFSEDERKALTDGASALRFRVGQLRGIQMSKGDQHYAVEAIKKFERNAATLEEMAQEEMLGLDADALRELAHREYEIAKLLGPDDEASQAWLDYVGKLVQVTDEYLGVRA